MALPSVQPDWYHLDNGFSNLYSMRTLHAPVVRLARRELTGHRGNVLDLGCGNGLLLRKVCSGRSGLVPFGIDSHLPSILHAEELNPEYRKNFVCGNIFDLHLWAGTRQYALIIVDIPPLLDVSGERSNALIDALKQTGDRVLVYVYPGWSSKLYPGWNSDHFEEIVDHVGLRLQVKEDLRVGMLLME